MYQTIGIVVQMGISLSLIILLPIGIILGIVFGLKASGTQDLTEKKKNKRRMWWSLTTPFIVIAFLTIGYGLLSAVVGFNS